MRGAARCAFALVVACSSGPTDAPDPAASTAEPAATELPALRVAHRDVRSLEVARGGARWRLEREDGGWWLVEPVRAHAHDDAVSDMLAVLQAIELEAPAPGDRAAQWLAGPHAIRVQVGGDTERSFTVGRADGEGTFVATGDVAYRATGRFRRFFARRVDELRDPVITDLDPAAITEVSYDNRHGAFSLRRDGDGFVAIPPLDDLFAERAAQQVGVVAKLRAQGFVEDAAGTGLDDPARVHLELRGGPSLDVLVGGRAGRRLYLRTSRDPQVYLVSAHLESSLVPRLESLRAPAKAPEAPHDHPHEAAPTRLSPKTLAALRALASEQAADR